MREVQDTPTRSAINDSLEVLGANKWISLTYLDNGFVVKLTHQ